MEDVSVWIMLLDQLFLPLAILFLTPIVVALVNRLLLMLKEKWNIDIRERKMIQIDSVVEEAISYASERARSRLNGEESGSDPMTGPEKLEAAVKYAKDRGEQLRIPELLDDYSHVVAERIESRLFDLRGPKVER